MDAQVQTFSASTINGTLVSAVGSPPNAATSALWASDGHYIVTRVTGNRFTLLMATLRNNSGSNLPSVTVSYNLTTQNPVTEQILGHSVYYSLSGTAGTWQKIAAFSGVGTSGLLSTSLPLGNWPVNGTMYLLWTDDNGSGTPDTAVEIDNFSVALPFPGIFTQPQDQSVSPGQNVTFTVTAVGAQPLTYQWLKNSNVIAGATSSNYTVINAQSSDQAFYSVVVSNAFGRVVSSNAFLTVSCSAPAGFTAVPQDQSLNPGGAISLSAAVNGTAPVTFQWYKNGTPLANATNATYTKFNAQPGDSGLYSVTIDNCAQLPSTASAVVSVSAQPYVLVGLTTQNWKYDQSDTAHSGSGDGWQNPGYNDSAWLSGRSVLAFEDNAAVTPFINTTLNHLTPNDIITRYFRTTFVLTNDPSQVSLLSSNLFDDGVIVYLNGVEAFRYDMQAGPVTHATLATAANPAGEGIFVVSNLPPNLLVTGTNTLAVELHQNSAGSSDSVMGMEVRVSFLPQTLLAITNQPQNLVVEETRAATFTLGLQGQPAYFQWYKDGVAISNATRNPFTIASTSTNDAGSYFAVATNSVNSVTSSVVTLSILADTNGPTLVEADGTISNQLVLVSFSDLILPTTATNLANYKITNTLGGTLTITKAVQTNGSNVLLTTSAPRLANNNYLLIVNNVQDTSLRANVIAPNSRIPISSLVPLIALNGGWRFYDPFPPFDAPDLGTTWKEFTYTETNAWGDGSGIFVASGIDPTTVPGPIGSSLSVSDAITTYFRTPFNLQASPGDLQFFLTHVVDDGAVFYLNGAEILRFNMPAGAINYQTLAASIVGNVSRIGPVSITAPSFRSGGNLIAVELHQTQIDDAFKIFGLQLDAKVESYAVGPVIIASGPTDQTVIEGQPATFHVAQAGGTTFQWQSNNVNIAGATNASYNIASVNTNMDGAQFHVTVNGVSSSALSSNATLHVISDTNPPTLVSAFYQSANSILVSFSETLNAASATTAGNYHVTNTVGATAAISGATLNNGTNVLLTFSAPLSGRYVVVVNNVKDASTRGNPIAPNSAVTVGADYFLSFTSPWKYLLTTTNEEIETSFAAPSYDDSAWRGPSNGLLYVEGAALPAPKNTPLSLTDASGDRINTFYFRGNLVSPVAITNLTLQLRHIIDDGMVLYLNGVEIYRFNMPGGTVTAATQALAPAIGDASLQGPIPVTVNLLAGTNILAAEVHQEGTASSDVVFGIELSGSIPSTGVTPPAGIQITEQPRSRTNGVSSTAFFRVAATGGGQPIYYQWLKGGVVIPNATNALLTIPNVQPGDGALYSARATNSFSSALSGSALLTVTNGGSIICNPVVWTNNLRLITNSLAVSHNGNTNTIVLKWTNPETNDCHSNATVVLQRAIAISAAGQTLWTNVYTNVFGSATVTNSFTGPNAFFRLKVP